MELFRRKNFFYLGLIFTILLGINLTQAQTPKTQIAKNTKISKTTENNDSIRNKPEVSEKTDKTKKESETPKSKKAKPVSKPINSPLRRVGVLPSQTRSLSLNNAIQLALQNNNDIEVARNDVKIAESSLRSLLGNYDPVFTISPNYTNNVTPQPSTLGGADTSGVTRSNTIRADSSFFQPIRQGGGNLNVFFNNTRQETSSTFSQLNPTWTTNMGVSFTQPIFKNRKIDQPRRLIKIQRKLIAQSDADFRRQTIEIVSQVQRAYWDLVFALRDQQNRVANLNLAKENLRQVEARIAAGSAAPLQKAEVSTELANRESEVLTATQQVATAENALKRLLLKDLNAPEWSQGLVPTDAPVFSSDKINLDNVTKDAISNRPELSRLKLQNEINKIDLDFFKNQIKPQVDLNASYTLIGLSGSSNAPTGELVVPLISGNPSTSANAFLLQQLQVLNPAITPPNVTIPPSIPSRFAGGYGQSIRNLFSNDTRSITVGVTITFPLKNKKAKADLAVAQFQKERIAAQTRAQEQTVITEVRNAVQAVETSRQRVLSARRARENAQIQLDGERKLYDVGRSTTFLLFQRENALTNARNAEIRAETDYNKALADLQKATSTTFRANNIVCRFSKRRQQLIKKGL